MSWFKVDDKFHSHPKVVELLSMPCGFDALGLWTLLGSWCSDYGSNGRVTDAALRWCNARDESISALITVGLWGRNEDGDIEYHDWPDYRPAKKATKSKTLTNAERQALYRKRKRNAESNVTGNANSNVTVTPSRARFPDPVPIKSSNEDSSDKPLDAALSESPQADDIRRVFLHWVTKTWSGRGRRPVLDAKRRKRIQARLREGFTADELCQAIGNAAQGGWHAENGYTGLQTLLRDREAVEGHLGARATKPSNGSSSAPEELPPEPFQPEPGKRVSLQEAMGDWRPS